MTQDVTTSKPKRKKKWERLNEALTEIASYVDDERPEWLLIKRELLRVVSSDLRKGFTTRDPVTKKPQPPNNYEKKLAVEWERITGRPLIFTHDEKPKE